MRHECELGCSNGHQSGLGLCGNTSLPARPIPMLPLTLCPSLIHPAVPKFMLPSGVTWEGGLAGFTIQGPFNAATVVKVGCMLDRDGQS